MHAHIKSTVQRKISDFMHLEDGKIGSRTAFTVAALAGASTLGALLFAPATEAHVECHGNHDCDDNTICCFVPDTSYHCKPEC